MDGGEVGGGDGDFAGFTIDLYGDEVVFFDFFWGVGAEAFFGWFSASSFAEEGDAFAVGFDVGGGEGGDGFFTDGGVRIVDF